ncbi:hypothetical protein J5500_03145 [Candidatus Saccharibacteria bacterium]|nr:hypothetical protein [Candidatus Saccharibacteria bacterium]
MDENLTPTHFTQQEQAVAQTRNKDKKKLLLIVSAIAALVIITIIVVAVVMNNNKKQSLSAATQEEINSTTIDPGKISYNHTSGYSIILTVYANMDNDMSLESLESLLEAGQINKNYLKTDKSGKSLSYIAATNIDTSRDYTGQNIEFITFAIEPLSDTNELLTITDVTYHSYHGDEYDEISENSDGEYDHFSNGITNTYEELQDAIEDYLIRL